MCVCVCVCVCVAYFIIDHLLHMRNSSYGTLMLIDKLLLAVLELFLIIQQSGNNMVCSKFPYHCVQSWKRSVNIL